MKTQTSLVAQQIRLQQWAEQIKDCQSRPAGMNIDAWCKKNDITKANYYYRLRRVRKACLATSQSETDFVELPIPKATPSLKTEIPNPSTAAIPHSPNGISIEINSGASAEMIQTLIGAMAYVK